MMYKLREKISNGERPDFSEIKNQSTQKMLLEAILEKDLHNEENLLTYASVMGRRDWFKSIAKEIREQVGSSVRQLVVFWPAVGYTTGRITRFYNLVLNIKAIY